MKFPFHCTPPWRVVARCVAATAIATLPLLSALARQPASYVVTLSGHRPKALASARAVARVPASQTIHLTLALALHNPAGLDDLLTHLYTPGDPQQGDFLSPQSFASRFGPSETDYDTVAAYFAANGLTIDRTHSNRLLLDVSGPASAVERACGTRLMQYQTADGRLVRGPGSEPKLPAAVASRLTAIAGLDTVAIRRPHYRMRAAGHGGPGPLGSPAGLTPALIKAAYGLSNTTLTGAGQVLALFELDGYSAFDVTTYENQFGLPAVPLSNVLVDGFDGSAGSGALEVTLDIELMTALAPGASRILVYEGPNTDSGVLDTYNQIAVDNMAKSVSTSWGLDEGSSGPSSMNAENSIFRQMAAQGQSIFAASGDSGANDNGQSLSVDDPASQPYVTGVGGTTLTLSNGAYGSETTWSGSGGGISAVWPIPSYQSGHISPASQGSTTARNVPDVSLEADPNRGYAIRFGSWNVIGGTSCAAPLWAAFTALVNQQRAAAGLQPVGFLNPTLYTLSAGSTYATDFHDIADFSTNGFYPASPVFDDATGLGTFNGAGLLADLSSNGGGGGTGGTGQLLGNPGFENGSDPSPWIATSGIVTNRSGEPAHSGTWKAWLGGTGSVNSQVLYQQVAIPKTVTKATLSFWLHVDTVETSRLANDTLTLQVRSQSGALLRTLTTFSNTTVWSGFRQESFNLLPYKGQTIRITLVGVENGTRATSFVLDDFALDVQ